VERAIFTATLHRLFVSGSDRDCVSWMGDYDIPGNEGLALHHFYRAMAWVGRPRGFVSWRSGADNPKNHNEVAQRRRIVSGAAGAICEAAARAIFGTSAQILPED
jgi:hypothetical protein